MVEVAADQLAAAGVIDVGVAQGTGDAASPVVASQPTGHFAGRRLVASFRPTNGPAVIGLDAAFSNDDLLGSVQWFPECQHPLDAALRDLCGYVDQVRLAEDIGSEGDDETVGRGLRPGGDEQCCG